MISFKKFLAEFQKKYVCVEFDETSRKRLMQYAIDNGFNLTSKFDGSTQSPEDFDFHITIFFTTSTHDTPCREIKVDPFNIEVEGFELLGPDKNVPVLKVKKTSNLLKIRDMFIAQGYKDAWPEYKPHISLSYEKKPYDLSGLKLPNFPITVTKIKIENQEG